PRCSPRFKSLASAAGEFTNTVLSHADREFLRSLPTTATRTVQGLRFYMCHAAPLDPLFTYLGPDDPEWEAELRRIDADVLLTGHTHLPFVRRIGGRAIVNPGSLGQPKNGSPRACYATWRDGQFALCSCE